MLKKRSKEAAKVGKLWRERYDKNQRDMEERRLLRELEIEAAKEQELKQKQLEEEEKNLRGYDRMDRIYSMWKETFSDSTTTTTKISTSSLQTKTEKIKERKIDKKKERKQERN